MGHCNIAMPQTLIRTVLVSNQYISDFCQYEKSHVRKLLPQLWKIAEQDLYVGSFVGTACNHIFKFNSKLIGAFHKTELIICVYVVCKNPSHAKTRGSGGREGVRTPPPPRHATGQAGRATSHFTGIMQAARQTIEAVNNWRVTEKSNYCMKETKLEGSVWTFLREFERINMLVFYQNAGHFYAN